MFGKSNNIPARPVLVTTTEHIPNKQFEILQLVTVSATKLANGDFSVVMQAIQKKASAMGADAVVGFRATAFNTSINTVMQTAYGTAVRFIETEQ